MKTALIFTGGTIGSGVKDGYIVPDARKRYELLEGLDTADFDVYEPYNILSENLNSAYVSELIKCIAQSLEGHKAVIVMHGTDTLQYAAAASSYAFGLDSAPIIFVSSNYILSDSRANGRENFARALDFAENGHGRGTFISYKNSGEAVKIHRASRALCCAQYSDAVVSLGGEYGSYENGRFVKNPAYRESEDAAEPFGARDIDFTRAAYIRAYPGMAFPADAEAVLLETYHSGTAPESALENAAGRVFVLGTEDKTQYASTRAYERPNITPLPRAAAPAMYIKLCFALAAGRLCDMNKPIGGDILP